MLLAMISCDKKVIAQGKVVEHDNPQKPIEDVTVILSVNEVPKDTVTTDEYGNFRISVISGGFPSDEETVVVKKEGYATLEFGLYDKNPDVQENENGLVVHLKK